MKKFGDFSAKTGWRHVKLDKAYAESVKIPIDGQFVEGDLSVPVDPKGIVVFAHGNGSGRFSPRNQYVAKTLNQAGIGTLLIDLLTKAEEEVDDLTGQYRFDIALLATRLIAATNWLKQQENLKKYAVGFFGASTGAAAALIAAANFPFEVKAVVSRGGRPDLASEFLPKVRAPTLFLVGGNDQEVLELNRQAYEQVTVGKKLEVISGATHLFEEQGKLEEVAKLSVGWFSRHFG
jgi:putative phosphoribosyl transferase